METLFGRKRRANKEDGHVSRRAGTTGTSDTQPGQGSSRDMTNLTPQRSHASHASQSNASVGSMPETPLTESLTKSTIRVVPSPMAATGQPRDSGAAALRRSVLSNLSEARVSRPADADVERMFRDLMDRRDLLTSSGDSLPLDTSQNIANFNMDKKWTLVYNDLLTERNAERESEKTFRGFPAPTITAPAQQSTMVLMRNSPEWFIKKFMDGTVTSRHIESLAVTLRTCAIGWLQNFVEAKGTPVLSSFLAGLHSHNPPSEQDIVLEYEVLKAFRSLFNSKPGAHDALQHPKCISGITQSLVSSQLSTRKQAADILLFLCHWEKPEGHRLVLQGMDDLCATRNLPGRFHGWFTALESAIDGRGRMGSLVGASDEVRRLQMSSMPESGLTEYVANNMFLINAIVNSDIVDNLRTRVQLRKQMAESNLPRIMAKMRTLNTPDLDMQLSVYEKGAAADQEELLETAGADAREMIDPETLVRAVLQRVQDTRARDFFVSSLQNLLRIQREGPDLEHSYQLVNSMISTVAQDRNGAATEGNLESLLGTSVANVLGRFAEQDLLERVQAELHNVRVELQERDAEAKRLRHQLESSQGGLVGKLQAQVAELQQDLALSRENSIAVQRDMEEMERTYVDRILNLELGLRENAAMLKQYEENSSGAFAQFDRQVLRDSLERQVERSRTIRKLVTTNGRQEALPPMQSSAGTMEVASHKQRSTDSEFWESLPSIAQEESQPTSDAGSPKRSSLVPSNTVTPTLPPRSASRYVSSTSQRSPSGDAERIGSAMLDMDTSVTAAPASQDALPSSPDENEWSLQAVLASGMARNTDLQARMKQVRDARIRRRNESQPTTPEKGADHESKSVSSSTHEQVPTQVLSPTLSAQSAESAPTKDASAPPPPPPPPPAPGLPSSSGLVSGPIASFPTGEEGIPPPPPPPPPDAGLAANRQAPTVNPSHNANLMAQLRARVQSSEAKSPENQDSLLGVRTSYVSESSATAGPVHPPPAPPLMGMAGNLRKGVMDMAKNRMKQVQWDKLSAEHASNTIWGTNDDYELRLREVFVSEGVFDAIEEEFKAKEASKKLVAAVKKDQKELETHLNYATRQGIEMVLKRIKSRLTDHKQCTPEEVAHLIIHCDPQVRDQSILTELLRYYPESETKGRLGEYKNASDEQLRLLHPADRLVVLLMTVPHLKEKVKGLLYMTKYADTVELIRTGLNKIQHGSEAIMNAPKFAELLSVVLMFGNFLNATGIKGGAFGFRISSINKLVDTKAGDGTTLLHFVQRVVSQHFPSLDGFTEELQAATEACRVQLLDLKHDLAELKSGNTQHKKELDRLLGEHEGNWEDPYAKLMLPFLQQTTQELSKLHDVIQHTERVFHEALRFYGEGPDPIRRGFVAPKTMPTEEFFGIFKEFVAAYRKCKTDNAVRAQQRAAEAARRAAASERDRDRKATQRRKEAGVDDNAVLESLLGSLRASGGTPMRKRRSARHNARKATAELRSFTLNGDSGDAPPQSPSSMAAVMLAKLQREPDDSNSIPTQPSSAPTSRPERRRERRERTSVPDSLDKPSPSNSQTDTLSNASSTPKSPQHSQSMERDVFDSVEINTTPTDLSELTIMSPSSLYATPERVHPTAGGARTGSPSSMHSSDILDIEPSSK
ncbi:hypothetical protein MYAM1_000120 [Malassezia yamatoensis]|uniref:Uncharacterized protein n=1 Tax=Malassezia yamatoensis TaxID=253288 RepID=A0AAJ6CG91_9BASI|nr:hypothetical protein MYAM1_000120 [Malassezia yamatoensis]